MKRFHWFAAPALLFSSLAFCWQSLAGPPQIARLTDSRHFKQRPAWSPDGQQLLYTQHRAGKIQLVLLKPGESPQVITQGELPQYDACWSPDGKRIAFTYVKQSGTQGDVEVFTAPLDLSQLKPLGVSQGKLSHEEWAAWSPDDKRIAFTSTAEGNQEIYAIDPEGGNRQRLTNDPALDSHPAWSPDGGKLAFVTSRWGDLELALMDADGSNLVRLTTSRGLDDYPAWSPDGAKIAFTSHRDGNFEIYTINADGSQPTNMTRDPALDNFPCWSPGGRLTFVSNRAGGFEIYALPASQPPK